MKKKIFKGIGIFFIVAIFVLTIFSSYVIYILNLSKPIGSRLVIDRENMTISVNDDRDIRVLQIADTQITALGDAVKAMPIIKETVEKARPDLIVLTGDNFMDDSPKWILQQYIKFFDAFEIPWAPVVGNHDYLTSFSMEEMCEHFESSKYCLFKQGSINESYGNYCYNIERNGKVVYSLIFMDNAIKISQEHLDWYKETIIDIKQNNGEQVVPSWVFFHKPLVEAYYAYYYAEEDEIDGEKREGIAFVFEDAGMFNTAYHLGSTTAFIYGHNHRNSYICDYYGIKMCFGLKTGKTSYYDRDLMGGNVFVLKPDNTFIVERVFV